MRIRMNVTVPAVLAAASLAACSASEEPRNDAVNPNLNTNADAAAQTPGANSFTEDQARGHIENAGYTNVTQLVLTDTGLWQGSAMRNGQAVTVSVDYRGAVATLPPSATVPGLRRAGLRPSPRTRPARPHRPPCRRILPPCLARPRKMSAARAIAARPG